MLDKTSDRKQNLQKAIAKNPADTKALYELGKIEMEAKHYPETERLIEQAVGFAPSNPDYLAAFGQVVLANKSAREQGDRFQKAQSLFERAVRLAPKHAAALYGLAVLAAEQKQWVRAMSLSQQLLAVVPKDPASHGLRIGLLEHEARPAAIKAEFERYLALVPSDTGSLMRFLRLLGAQKPPPKSTQAQINVWQATMLGKTLTLLEANIEAAGRMAKPIPEDVQKLYLQVSNAQRRQDFATRLDAHFPTQKNILLFLATAARQDAASNRAGVREKIIRLYERVLRLDNKDRAVWFALGEQYELIGNKSQAIVAYTEVIRHNQTDSLGKASVEALKALRTTPSKTNTKP
jgi:cytochrome c-type biogenesis protein CcmH/NrfG